MLSTLDIRDLLIIDRLELVFQPGLNVLTGETGAGKSILLDALGFVLGWRGRADLVRAGADHPAHAVLREAGIGAEDGELILRRVNTADGRKTAWVNSVRVSGEVLRRLSDVLIELHGQQDDRGLLNPRGHRRLLDAYMAAPDLLEATRGGWASRRDAARRLAELTEAAEALRAEEDFLRHAVAEFDTLAPEAGEADKLDAERRLMQAAERIRADIGRALAAITGEGAEGMVRDATRWLEDAAETAEGRLDGPIEALSRAMDALAEAESGVEAALDALTFEAHALEAVEDRLFAIRALARKHDQQPDDLPAFGAELRARLQALDASAGDIAGAEAALAAAEAEYRARAERLTEARRTAAEKLEKAMARELAPLKLDRARFAVEIGPTEPGPEGADEVRFQVATNPGAPVGPLDKIASGGELSRFLLALKVCLTGGGEGLTMIFDEIDRGVGGATADAVGRRLAALSDGGQVLVVTHSPQVAARAGHHWRVEKSVAGKGAAEITTSRVVPLSADARVDELARMLAGDRITDAARLAARELLAAPSA